MIVSSGLQAVISSIFSKKAKSGLIVPSSKEKSG